MINDTSLGSDEEQKLSAYLSAELRAPSLDVSNLSHLDSEYEQLKLEDERELARTERKIYFRSVGIGKVIENDTPQLLYRSVIPKYKKSDYVEKFNKTATFKIPTPKAMFSLSRKPGFEPYLGRIFHSAHVSPKKYRIIRTKSPVNTTVSDIKLTDMNARKNVKNKSTGSPKRIRPKTAPLRETAEKKFYSERPLVNVAFSPYLPTQRSPIHLEKAVGAVLRSIKDPVKVLNITQSLNNESDDNREIDEQEIINSIRSIKQLAIKRKQTLKVEPNPENLIPKELKLLCQNRVTETVFKSRAWEEEQKNRSSPKPIKIVYAHKSNVRPISAPQQNLLKRLSTPLTSPGKNKVQAAIANKTIQRDDRREYAKMPLVSIDQLVNFAEFEDDSTELIDYAALPQSSSLLDGNIINYFNDEKTSNQEIVAATQIYDRNTLDNLCDLVIEETNLAYVPTSKKAMAASKAKMTMSERLINAGNLKFSRKKERIGKLGFGLGKETNENPFNDTGQGGGVVYKKIQNNNENIQRGVVEPHSPVKYWGENALETPSTPGFVVVSGLVGRNLKDKESDTG